MSGANLALIVAEPSAAGIHDLKRVLALVEHFKLPVMVCINKADLYLPVSEQIEVACIDRGVEIVGRIPFDPMVTEAMVRGEPVTAYQPGAPASQALMKIWPRVRRRLGDG